MRLLPSWRVRLGTIVRFGDVALRFPAASPEAAASLAETVRALGLEGVTDVVGGLDSVLVQFDPEKVDFDSVARRISRVRSRPMQRSGRLHVLPVGFDGPDLEAVGRLSGLGTQGVVRALAGARLQVSVVGFTPGFAYLSGLPPALAQVPRRETPRPSVPAGSVALGGGHAAVYPQATPGGWQLVGHTDAVLFDPAQPPYALLQPGDTVRFEATDPDGVVSVEAPGPAPRRVDEWTLRVEVPGTYTTLQDGGRHGVAHLGVPRAGAADPVSLALANALVGNEPGSACLEVTMTGPTLLCGRPTHVAVVGVDAEVTLDGHRLETGRVVPIGSGQRLAVASTGRDARAYLAVRGGLATPLVLGSRSTDRLTGLGGGPLQAGDQLAAGEPAGPLADHLRPGASATAERSADRVLRALPVTGAPRTGDLFGRVFRVDSASDRVGVRLRPADGGRPEPTPARATSAGMTVGAIQVPPDGDPVVLLVDHATLGGYRVAAVVISADWSELGRCRPGDRVVFESVTPDEADLARRAQRRALADAVSGAYPERTD